MNIIRNFLGWVQEAISEIMAIVFLGFILFIVVSGIYTLGLSIADSMENKYPENCHEEYHIATMNGDKTLGTDLKTAKFMAGENAIFLKSVCSYIKE